MDAAVATWRRQKRTDLVAARQSVPVEDRRRAAEAIGRALDGIVAGRAVSCIGIYWPIRHEINLLPWAHRLARQGMVLALPVVVTPKAPLEYWRWAEGENLARGIWDIPVPAQRDPVLPELVLAPLVGFDRANYRLGNGGGYFDRTLAALSPRPVAVGIGYDFGALDTIYPQPHDVPMDTIVTESRVI
jgi:5-formyltetrahydrofolate cyclo-ligase